MGVVLWRFQPGEPWEPQSFHVDGYQRWRGWLETTQRESIQGSREQATIGLSTASSGSPESRQPGEM